MQEDILVKARLDYKQVLSGFKDLEKAASSAKRQLAGVERQMQAAAAQVGATMKGSFAAAPSAGGMTKDIVNNQKRMAAYWDDYYRGAQGVTKANAQVKKSFDMNALSVLFFGQAMQQAAMSVARFGVKAYTDVMHSVEGTVTQTDYLNSSMMYLGFVIGQALEPVVAFLVPIIDAVANWVSENETLVRALVVSGVVIGGLLFLYGTLKLGLFGVAEAAKDVWSNFTALSSVMNNVDTPTGLQNFKTFLAVALVAAIVAVIFWIYKLQEQMGGWGEFFKSVARGILRTNQIILAAFAGMFSEIGNGFQWLWNKILDGLESFINKAVVFINKFIDGINRVFKTNIGSLSPIDFDGMKADVKEFGDSFIDTYSDMMEKYLEFENKYLAPEKGFAEFGGFMPEYEKELAAAQSKATGSTVVYNNNTINVDAGVAGGMEEVKRAFEASGVRV